MSTTFCVYPKKEYVPTFAEVIDLTSVKLNNYLYSINLPQNVSISAEIQTVKEHNKVLFSLNEKMKWDEEKYAWFYVNGIAGGTDCYFYEHTDLDREIWADELKSESHNQEIKTIIKNSLDIGYFWSFRRSAGQPGIIALLYGLLAASIAKLTEGFVYSDDGAWNHTMFPALADDFWGWYFRPELTTHEDDKSFSTNCIKSLFNELNK